jgi:hypothetical protein
VQQQGKRHPLYTNFTMAMNHTVSANYLHLMQLQMNDGGCHYHLSANPGTIISENYCKSKGSGLSGTTWGEYADEGSAYLTIAKNALRRATSRSSRSVRGVLRTS